MDSGETAEMALRGDLNTILPFAGEELLDDEIEGLIEERLTVRRERNFSRADEIRDLLKEKGIILEDTAQGTRWKRG